MVSPYSAPALTIQGIHWASRFQQDAHNMSPLLLCGWSWPYTKRIETRRFSPNVSEPNDSTMIEIAGAIWCLVATFRGSPEFQEIPATAQLLPKSLRDIEDTVRNDSKIFKVDFRQDMLSQSPHSDSMETSALVPDIF